MSPKGVHHVSDLALPTVSMIVDINIGIPTKKRLKGIWSGISETSTALWTRSAASSCQLRDKTVIWFVRLPPVIWFETRYPGWQAGVVIGIVVATIVFTLNFLFLILAVRVHWGSDGLGTLVEGDCTKLNRWNKMAHGFINIMSTVRSTRPCHFQCRSDLCDFSFF